MKLKELRLKLGLTQTELANKLNLSKNQILRYENKTSEIPANYLIEMADFFKISLDYLCDRQWNNQIGYIPDSKKNTIQKLLELDDMNFERVDTYINARLEVQNEQHYNKKAEG